MLYQTSSEPPSWVKVCKIVPVVACRMIDFICVPAGASPLQPRSKFCRGPRVRPCGKQLVPSSGKTFSISLVFGLITAISPLAWTDVLWFVLLIALVQEIGRASCRERV